MFRTSIIIADGSLIYKKMFTQAFSSKLKNTIITSASSKEELLTKVKVRNYDIIVLDAELAGSDLSNLLHEIVRIIPQIIILITARPSKTNTAIFSVASASGVADYMEKPIYDSYEDNFKAIKNKVTAIVETLFEKHKGKEEIVPMRFPTIKRKVQSQSFTPEMVLIAASTGGPKALEYIFSKINPSFSLPILVVQHILPHFAEALAENLNSKTKLNVKLAEDGEKIKAGTVYIAQSGLHMKLDSKRLINLDNSPALNGIKPAADTLFESVSEIYNLKGALAVVLTGMGHDGVRGLSLLKERQACFCLTQSEKTCVVYGMPKAVQENGFSDMIVDLEDIAEKIESFDVQI